MGRRRPGSPGRPGSVTRTIPSPAWPRGCPADHPGAPGIWRALPHCLEATGTPSGVVVGRRLPYRVTALLRPAAARTRPRSPGLISAVGRDRPDLPRTGPRSCFGVSRHGTAGPGESRGVRGFTPGRHPVTRVGPRPCPRDGVPAEHTTSAAPGQDGMRCSAPTCLVARSRALGNRRGQPGHAVPEYMTAGGAAPQPRTRTPPYGTAEDPTGEPRRAWLARAGDHRETLFPLRRSLARCRPSASHSTSRFQCPRRQQGIRGTRAAVRPGRTADAQDPTHTAPPP